MEEMYQRPLDGQIDKEKQRAEWIRQKFQDFGLDEAVVIPYQALLTYPDTNQLSNVRLIDESGRSVFITPNKNTVLSSQHLTNEVLLTIVSRNGFAEVIQ
jgi:hypothetical protein